MMKNLLNIKISPRLLFDKSKSIRVKIIDLFNLKNRTINILILIYMRCEDFILLKDLKIFHP